MEFGLRLFLLFTTVVLTAIASLSLTLSMMTDRWETIVWNSDELDSLITANFTDIELQVTKYLDDRVTSVTVQRVTSTKMIDIARVFLVPMHGGIWTLCVSLTDEERFILEREGFPETECINYLDSNADGTTKNREERKKDWQQRKGRYQPICFLLLQEKEQQKRLWMQNLSISCALVCLIILGSSAIVGAFGVLKNQISAVLVTGVMYLLAATFALFTLVIIHYKWRSTECPGPGADGMIAVFGSRKIVKWISDYLAPARISSGSWSRALGWTALSLCVLTSLFWILLSIVMRASPRVIA